jgi:hypothetical protein
MADIPTLNPDWKSVGRTSNTSYYMAGDDMLIILPDAGLKDNAASARENSEFQIGIARRLGRPLGLVVYLTSLLGQDAEARKVYASMDRKMFSGSALVVSNQLARAIGSFFLGLSRPAFPAKLVSTIEEGIAWIATLPEHHEA